MKWPSGADAVMLYSETPNVHMHTLKVAIIKLDEDRRNSDIEVFRRAIRERLYKLEPFWISRTGTMPNLTISNVACHFERRGRVGGAVVSEFYSVGQLSPWSGLNITVWSYVD